MKCSAFRSAALVLLALLVAACATSPTGRRQVLLNSPAQMAEMGRTAFDEMKTATPLSTSTKQKTYVRCVATAITNVLTPEELSSVGVTGWEIEVFEDASANAFALPGGKIGVHVGLLTVATSPGQLAAVLGHEVGHVLAQHGNERVSQSVLAQTGMDLAAVMVGADTPEKQQLFGLLGVGMQYGVLMPYGRTQESEADEIGLTLMARAGFDPNEAIRLWENMSAASGGAGPPEILSTHPSHGTRIQRLQAAMPQAVTTYDQARAAGRAPTCRP